MALPFDPRSVEEYLAITDTGILVHSPPEDDTQARRLAEALTAGGD
ncbi:hypothetical protein [Kitasatospora sp. NPDC001547]